MRTLLKPLSFIPAIILMYMIFTFSNQPAEVSGQLSFRVSCKIIEVADSALDTNMEQWKIEEWANKINFITRKLAHMAEYFLLAVAVSFPLYVYGLHGILLMIVAGIFCIGFAVGDEYHQAFVAGRSSSMRDVAIDSIGIFSGIILTRIIGWTGRKTIFRPKKPKEKKISKRKQKRIDESYHEPFYQQTPYQKQPTYQQAPHQRPHYSNANTQSPPLPQDTPNENPKKKKKKKEKDWFFDI